MSAPTRDELAELRSFTVSTVNDALRLLNFKDSLLDYIAALEAQVRQLRTITDEVVSIMETYHEQEKSAWGVGTPGGLEHMGDVWGLLEKWARAALAATEPKP